MCLRKVLTHDEVAQDEKNRKNQEARLPLLNVGQSSLSFNKNYVMYLSICLSIYPYALY